MRAHAKVRNVLYEYVRNELSPFDHERVARHLQTCTRCARDLERITAVITVLKNPDVLPSDTKPPEFWDSFVSAIEERIKQRERARAPQRHLVEHVRKLLLYKRRYVLVGLGAVAFGLAVVFIWRQPPADNVASTDDVATPAETSQERLNQYLRKSKTLLVGIENMKAEAGQPIDLRAERKVSRALVDEARFLKQQPLDMRSARLMNDVDKILIELANTDERGSPHRVELIRGGIRQENLLFKIRMAENSARFVRATSSED